MKYFATILICTLHMHSAYSSENNNHNNDLPVSQNATRIRILEEKLDKRQAHISIPDQFEITCHDCCLGKAKMVSKHLCDKIFPNSWNNQNCPCFDQD
jgi:hypothetical protein